MSFLVPTLGAPSSYRDKKYPGTRAELENALATSTTLYVGNTSFYTTEEQIYQLFSKVGEVKRIIMGLDRVKKTPCGFCFIEYYTRKDALDCMKFLNGTKCDERSIRTDIDPGFTKDRQYGRGRSGGQVRDEFREDYDQGRGGWGSRSQDSSRVKSYKENYQTSFIPNSNDDLGYYSKSSRDDYKKKRGRDDEFQEKNPRFRSQDSP
jgi:nuclear cap-binding protein subunit 2